MAESKGTARTFGRRANPTIAFDPETEVKAIERRRKAAMREERKRARMEKAMRANGRANGPATGNSSMPSAAKSAKPRARSYFVAGLACLAVAMTMAGLAPQFMPAILP
jgi:hypothetical protein